MKERKSENILPTPNTETLEAFAELDNGGGHKFTGSTEALFAELPNEKAAKNAEYLEKLK